MRRFKVSGYQTTGQNPEFGGSFKVKISPKRCLETRYNNYYGFEAGIGFKVESKK
jgi:translocation and assembly module TamB